MSAILLLHERLPQRPAACDGVRQVAPPPHSGLLRVYVRHGEGPRVVRWQMYGDQQPGWKSADIELIITSVTEVYRPTGRYRHSASLDSLQFTVIC